MRCFVIICLSLFFSVKGLAHPMPNSVLLLDIKQNKVVMELQLPLGELQSAYGKDITSHTASLIEREGAGLREYILAHVHPVSKDGSLWTVEIKDMKLGKVAEMATGPYQELIVYLVLQPPAGTNCRVFTLNYDVIIHQVATHQALVSVRQDWDRGMSGEHITEVGAISLDIRNNRIPPLEINQAPGSLWRGFKSMLHLGMQHIKEGTDHLLFLLVLLLTAPLLINGKNWTNGGGVRYSVLRIIKVVTAFTIGHSITLLAGAVGWLHLPQQPVEVLIAFSILVSAIHVIKPLFPGKEMYVAAGFGLIHGLAFASTLANLDLDGRQLALSIAGFNIGIELMQLFIIILVVPVLILLSRSFAYTFIRIGGAVLATIAALIWIVERVSDNIS